MRRPRARSSAGDPSGARSSSPAPRVRSRYLDPTPPVVLAHRGFDRDGRENTLRAFRAALDLRASYLETDVHATSDGVVVAFHDDVLDHVSDGHGPLAAHTWEQLRTHRVAGEPIVTFAELLDTLPHALLNVDVKSPAAVEPFAALLLAAEQATPGTLARICVASFSDRRRRAVLRRLPAGVCSSAGMASVAMFFLASRRIFGPAGRSLARLALFDVDVLQVPLRHGRLTVVDRRFVDVAHRIGRPVHVWTINDAPTMRYLLDLGVDGIVTDRADLALDVVAGHRAKPHHH